MNEELPGWIASLLAAPATGYISTGSLLAIAITLILTGKLRPGKEVDYWREAYFKSEETKKVLVEQNTSLLNFAPLIERAFSIAFPTRGRTLNEGHEDDNGKKAGS